MSNEKIKITDYEKLKLSELLNQIWKLGDRDEMSIKHIGHGLAALVAFGDWQKCIDYDRPNSKWNKQKETKLFFYWEFVKQILDGITRYEAIGLFGSLHLAWYGAAYLEWPEYGGNLGQVITPNATQQKEKEII